MKIYVASSWRNEIQPVIVDLLRSYGHEVYDFRNPCEGNHGFAWSALDPEWEDWTPERYKECLVLPVAEAGFKLDFDAMKWADACVLVLPCGRSAHTEAGWMAGMGKPTYVVMLTQQEPELMYKIFDEILISPEDIQRIFKTNGNQ